MVFGQYWMLLVQVVNDVNQAKGGVVMSGSGRPSGRSAGKAASDVQGMPLVMQRRLPMCRVWDMCKKGAQGRL
jgi:hypothetical protein